VGSEPPEEPVPAERIWAKLEDEIICHSCFKDYITVVGAHPPSDVKASMADCSSLLGNGFAPAAGAVDPVLNGVELQEEKAQLDGPDAAVEEEEQGDQQRPPWDERNTWRDLYNYELHEFSARAWLPTLDGKHYGAVWPMILMVMTIGIKDIGDGECKCSVFHCCSPN
jgi:hypothetical protein